MTVTYDRPDPVPPILDALLSALTDALAATTAGAPGHMVIGHGSAVALDCAPMGWVRPVLIYPSAETFGSPDGYSPRKQPFRWAIDVELGVIRCVRGVKEHNHRPILPTPAEVTADSATILDDTRALRSVVQYLHPWRDPAQRTEVLIRRWQPIAAQGGVAGGTIQITVSFADCKPTVT